MPKRSIFRDFITALRQHWRIALPSVRPLDESFGRRMPKASTFYAGVAHAIGMHVFLHFQHSCMAWEVGQFTINVILSRRQGEPERPEWGLQFAPEDGVSFVEGSYRIGNLLGRKDKWWHLKDDSPPIATECWRPTRYDDDATVIAEAAASVTGDIEAVLRRLGVCTSV